MEMRRKKLPIGIDNFEKLRCDNFYYINKAGMIRELLNHWGEVNLFTRPRRFGKTLNMSMLEHFFRWMGIRVFHQELTYEELYQTTDNIWSLLFTTGYLTQWGKAEGRQMKLAIPNLEIRDIFQTQIMEFFKENVREDGDMLNRFFDALQNGNAEDVEKVFTEYLRNTISIRHTAVRTDLKENFFHGVLLGILGVKTRWGIFSNREMGEGYADLLAEPDTGDMGFNIEVKYAHDGDLNAACKEALKQIEYTKYEDDLSEDGVEKS